MVWGILAVITVLVSGDDLSVEVRLIWMRMSRREIMDLIHHCFSCFRVFIVAITLIFRFLLGIKVAEETIELSLVVEEELLLVVLDTRSLSSLL